MGYEREYAIEARPMGYADIIYVKVVRASHGAALTAPKLQTDVR